MSSTNSERGRILIVDDDQNILDLLVELLTDEGYEVATATDGAEGFDLALAFLPDTVVSDVVMPVVDGLELCRRLKAHSATAKIPVILISGNQISPDDDIHGLHAGADDYLSLPFRTEELMVKVARLAERHRIEKHYREIVEEAADIIYTRDMNGYLTSINAAGARFFGKSAHELVGTHLGDLIDKSLADRDIEETKRSDTPSPYRSTYCLHDAKGERRYLEGVITIERDRQGKAVGVRGVVRDITDQKLAQDALRETETRLRTVVGSASLILFSVDTKGIFTLCEGEGLKALSLRPGQLVGQSIFEVYADAPKISDHIRRALSGESFTAAVEVGELILDVRYSPLTSHTGKILGVIGAATDITETRKAQVAIQESGERYRELFENANDIIYTHDLKGNFTSLNRTGERITGYTREEAMKMNVADVIAPEDLQFVRNMIAQKTTEKVSTVYEVDIITKAGNRVRLEVSTRLILRDGKPIGIQGIARDLTERKRSEQALRESQAFFNSFMDNSPAVAFMKDTAGRYVYVNKPFERLFGKELKFLRGKTSFDWLPQPVAQETHDHDLKVLTSGYPEEIFETVPTEDGTPHQWLVFKFPTTDAAGNKYVAGVGVDISERRSAEEALAQQAQREAMSHRISQAIRCSLDSREIFQTAVRELGSYLKVGRCSLYMRDDWSKRATKVAEYHADGVRPAESDFDLDHLQALIDALDQTGVLAFNDAANDPRITQVYETILKQAEVKSIMYVAIRVGDDVPAAFALSTTKASREWSDSDIALAKAVADQTGIAIRQSQLYQKAAATSKREALVNRLTMIIRASLSLADVLSTSTRELGRALSASRVHLYLNSSDDLSSAFEHEYVADGVSSIKNLGVTYNDPIGRQLSGTKHPLIIDDAWNFHAGPKQLSTYIRSSSREFGIKSQISYPLVVKGQFRGVLGIHQTDHTRRWTEDEVSLIDALAERLAIAIAQAELFEMVARGKGEWETTFDAMSDGMFIFDQVGALKRVNRAGAAMEAVHPRILLGRKCCDILQTSDEEGCIVEKAIADGRSVTVELTPIRLNRPLLVTVEPVLQNDKLIAVVCTARDLSELRKVQAVAREHQSLLTNILESARESIYAVDPEGYFKWSNTATLKGLGYERHNLIGRHVLDMVYEGDRTLVQEKLDAALAGEPQTYEMRYYSHDGGLRYARVDNSPLVVDGKTTGVLGIARDITEQKEERERAARADKLRALGQLASGVAHDFNNSLAAILGRAQLLRRQISDEALLRNLGIIQTAAEDAAATVRRIQTFARKSPAKEFDIVDVRSLLNDAVEITRTRWENEARLRGLEYEVKLEADRGCSTYGSASELREVFVNLIVNAVDAMPKGGNLSIKCWRNENTLELQFKDDGLGMAEDVRQKIFEPFFSTKGAQGTGLGLSVSYSIIERHEGSISVSSEIGKGTVFTVTLPLRTREISKADDLLVGDDQPSLDILVVDDEGPVRETLAEMLVAANHRVELVESGQQAIKKLRTRAFDFVFTDLAMPEMDGWETARAIRRHWPETKIVLVTGYGFTAAPPEGEEELVDAIIGKPFNFRQVTSTLGDLQNKELVRA
ncbi:MAG TPA: PAS domain S-box protein [Pyrinomonadaceae bacterium]|nr:PAS domain S-box protein [Pyrinomonadaceae bacterium]